MPYCIYLVVYLYYIFNIVFENKAGCVCIDNHGVGGHGKELTAEELVLSEDSANFDVECPNASETTAVLLTVCRVILMTISIYLLG